MSEQERSPGLSRRRLFGWVGAGTAGVLAAGATGGVIGRTTALETASAAVPDDPVEFTGPHQAGIVTPARTGCTSSLSTSPPTTATSSSRC